jgi:ketosteroid isomerase-like protein
MKQGSQDEQALIKIQHDWAQARLKRDSSFAQQIEADDFTVVWFDGRIVNKQEDVKSYESDDVSFTDFKINDLKVRFYGDTAIVVGQGSLKAHTKKTRPGRKIRLDRHIYKTEWQLEGGRVAGDSGIGKIIAHAYS